MSQQATGRPDLPTKLRVCLPLDWSIVYSKPIIPPVPVACSTNDWLSAWVVAAGSFVR